MRSSFLSIFLGVGLLFLGAILSTNGEISVKHVFDLTGDFTFNQKMADECLNSTYINVQSPFRGQSGIVTVKCHMSWKPDPYWSRDFRILVSRRTSFSLGCVSGGLEFHSSKTAPTVSLRVNDWWYCGYPRERSCHFTKQVLEKCLNDHVNKTQIGFDFMGVTM